MSYSGNDINSYTSYVLSQSNKNNIKISKEYFSRENNNNNLNSSVSIFERRKNLVGTNNYQSLNLYSNKNKLNNNKNQNDNGNNAYDYQLTKSLLTKLPIISKYGLASNLNDLNNDYFINLSQNQLGLNTSKSNERELISDNINNRNSYIKSDLNNFLFKGSSIYDYKNSTNNFNKVSNNSIKSKFDIYNKNSIANILSPSDNKFKINNIKKEPKFGKMKKYIILPDFIGDEPLTEMIFNPTLKNDFIEPSEDKQYEVNLYLNSNKMQNNLIYLKTYLNKEGYINNENILNIKKLNKQYKDSDCEEEDNQQTQPEIQNIRPPSVHETPSPHNIKSYINQTMSISEYPGNFRPKNKNNNKEFKLNSTSVDKFYINNEKNIKSYRDFNSLKYNDFSDNLKKQYNENYTSDANLLKQKSDYSDINNNSDNENGGNETSIQINTIYNENIKPYYTKKDEKDETLIFESRFESGNLLCAFKTDEENNYQLYLENDTNTTGYIQWFFYRVSNIKKGTKVNFNIINMLRKKCIYKKGLKIMIYSKQKALNENIGWHRGGENIIYYTNNLYIINENNGQKRNLHSLSFDYEFEYNNDTVYFANSIPYFYTKLTKELNSYKIKYNKFLFKHTISLTLGGNDLEMLTINDTSLIKQNKKIIILIARQHPGETVGSFVIKGCIDFLLNDSEEAKKLRELYIFKIIPMMNPDGVLVGNSRTSFAGCDLNRRWGKPNEIIHPEIFNTKNMILSLAQNNDISFIIDFHGHFGNYNSFFYCNYKNDKTICSLFPYLCSKISKIISFEQSTFTMPKYKNSTERITLFRELNDNNNDNIVALETSFFGSKGEENKNFYFNSNLLKEIGRDVCLGMLSYYVKKENIKIENLISINNEKIKNLDVDMLEFESDLIKEVNENQDYENNDDEKDDESESEPSIDNFDKNKIIKLMPIPQKKKKKKAKINNYRVKKIIKGKPIEKHNDNKNKIKEKNIKNIEIELYNPIKEQIKKLKEEEEKKKICTKTPVKTSLIKNSDTTKNKIKNNLLSNIIPTESNLKNNFTQTEEIFFRMHWTYFVGKYKILTGIIAMQTNNINIFGLPDIPKMPLNLTIKASNHHYLINSVPNKKKSKGLISFRGNRITNWFRSDNSPLADEKILKINDKVNNNLNFMKSQSLNKNSNKINDSNKIINFNVNMYDSIIKLHESINRSNNLMKLNKNIYKIKKEPKTQTSKNFKKIIKDKINEDN